MLKQGNRCHIEPFGPRLGSLMASSWKLATAGLPRSLTVAEWKCWPYVFTGCDPDLVWFQPKSLGVTRMNSSDWYRIKQQFKWSLLAISLPPWRWKKRRQAKPFIIILSLTTVIHSLPPAEAWVSNVVCFQLTLGEKTVWPTMSSAFVMDFLK